MAILYSDEGTGRQRTGLTGFLDIDQFLLNLTESLGIDFP